MSRPATDLTELIKRVIPSQTKQYNGFTCLEWTGKFTPRGYAKVSYNNKTCQVSRLVASLYLGLDLNNPRYIVCHHCDNPKCIEHRHLFVGTHRMNTQDAVAKGRLVPFRKRARIIQGSRMEEEK